MPEITRLIDTDNHCGIQLQAPERARLYLFFSGGYMRERNSITPVSWEDVEDADGDLCVSEAVYAACCDILKR